MPPPPVVPVREESTRWPPAKRSSRRSARVLHAARRCVSASSPPLRPPSPTASGACAMPSATLAARANPLSLIEAVSAMLQGEGEPPAFDPDAQNAAQIAERADKSAAEILDEMQAAYEAAIAGVGALDDGTLAMGLKLPGMETRSRCPTSWSCPWACTSMPTSATSRPPPPEPDLGGQPKPRRGPRSPSGGTFVARPHRLRGPSHVDGAPQRRADSHVDSQSSATACRGRSRRGRRRSLS